MMSMERQQTDERDRMSIEEAISLQSVVHRKCSKCMQGSGGLVQLLWIVALNKIVRYLASAGLEEERNERVTITLNRFSMRGVNVLAELVREKVQDPAVHRLFESSIFLCREAGLFRLGTLCA